MPRRASDTDSSQMDPPRAPQSDREPRRKFGHEAQNRLRQAASAETCTRADPSQAPQRALLDPEATAWQSRQRYRRPLHHKWPVCRRRRDTGQYTQRQKLQKTKSHWRSSAKRDASDADLQQSKDRGARKTCASSVQLRHQRMHRLCPSSWRELELACLPETAYKKDASLEQCSEHRSPHLIQKVSFRDAIDHSAKIPILPARNSYMTQQRLETTAFRMYTKAVQSSQAFENCLTPAVSTLGCYCPVHHKVALALKFAACQKFRMGPKYMLPFPDPRSHSSETLLLHAWSAVMQFGRLHRTWTLTRLSNHYFLNVLAAMRCLVSANSQNWLLSAALPLPGKAPRPTRLSRHEESSNQCAFCRQPVPLTTLHPATTPSWPTLRRVRASEPCRTSSVSPSALRSCKLPRAAPQKSRSAPGGAVTPPRAPIREWCPLRCRASVDHS
mmetsp:Transcript_3942/g.10833  ORF Transcript_3942/g.10833 Transcript_3942/m.10833 type:complete len:443 (-) Transcript_3942:250-1578(-)